MENNNAMVFIPEEEITVSFEVTDDKPFNQCFECRSFRNGCSGPNLFAMGVLRACEFLQLARIFLGYSYQNVADATELSLTTVKRILTGKVSDPSYYTLKVLNDYLLGDPNGKYPCAIPNVVYSANNDAKLNDALRELERALNDNKDYRNALDNIHASYNAEMQTIRAEEQRTIDALNAQIDRLHVEVDNLWAENNRKAKVIDTFLEKQNILLTEKRETV